MDLFPVDTTITIILHRYLLGILYRHLIQGLNLSNSSTTKNNMLLLILGYSTLQASKNYITKAKRIKKTNRFISFISITFLKTKGER